MEYKVCCCTGHRPKGFGWDYRNKEHELHREYLAILEYEVRKCVEKGFNYFISGGAIGADMDFAETVMKVREEYPNVKLEIAVPCENQDLKWNEEDKKRYREILQKAAVVKKLSEKYTMGCMQKRNRYMVDSSELVIAIWNGISKGGTYSTIQYADKKNVPMTLIGIFPPNGKEFFKNFDYHLEFTNSLETRKKKDAAVERVLRFIK